MPQAEGLCAKRVFIAATDERLLAIDALKGTPCPGFGEQGVVDLKKGIVQRNPGFIRQTSAPTVVRGKVVLGSAIADGQHAGEPSGVIRAFDAVTGKLAWAWDVDNPEKRGEPGEGEVLVQALWLSLAVSLPARAAARCSAAPGGTPRATPASRPRRRRRGRSPRTARARPRPPSRR